MSLKFFLKSAMLSALLATSSVYTTMEYRSDKIRIENASKNDSKISGKIEGGRYFSSDGAFSCQAYHFGKDKYDILETINKEDGTIKGIDFSDITSEVSRSIEAQITPHPTALTEAEIRKISDQILIELTRVYNRKVPIQAIDSEKVGEAVYFKAIVTTDDFGRAHPRYDMESFLVYGEESHVIVLQYRQNYTNWSDGKTISDGSKKKLLEFKESLELKPLM